MERIPNPLISQKSSDSGLHAYLHPLVLLNISDHITRHAVRQQRGPIVGALLGQQKGRSISLEHVFECNTVIEPNGDVFLHQAWFSERLQQFKDVHKSPALDLVGWFTITLPTGPTPAQLPLHHQILEQYNEAAILLAFHASELQDTSSTIGKLPLTIYESVYEEETMSDGDRSMEIDGQARQLALRFRELPYSIETEEAEMISVDFVASGGGNAAAIDSEVPSETKAKMKDERKERQPKKEAPEVSPLSREDEDLIANLTVRLGAVRTLESRLRLIKAYLQSAQSSTSSVIPSPSSPPLSNSILRSIYSLISHLTLLNPQDSDSISVESLAQANDVALVALLCSMGESIRGLREVGKKFAVARAMKHSMAAQHGMESQMRGAMW
ncbi:COP9 signalosome subunit 6 [Coccidioides immitis RS]|uniref:COP9 signalosome complex subunit 6 n=1 Tax=Coccidioides immitis (strain RS) TaxID=246410 RepID=J3K7C4_COCIM|nr:COP9 signalosome subunit 6 [Coccidioides immitis RS]EAS30588.3 COP9 signalosome subunit 6 [Coccidioides immitis RS]